jgi:exosortase
MQKEQTSGILDDFRVDFVKSWQQLPDKMVFFVLFAAWCALFHFVGNPTLGYVHSPSLFRWMLDAYHPAGDYAASEDAHGLIVPFVVLALLWWKRKRLLALTLKPWWPGLLLLALALLVHVVGYMIQQPRVSMVGFFGGLYVLTGVVWGAACLRNCFFPFFLFAFCVPLGPFSQAITTPLRHLVAVIVTGIAHLGLAPDLVRQGTQLFDAHDAFRYDIAPACSGIRSLVSLLAFTTIFGFVSFSGWKRWLIVGSAVPLAIIGNVARITFTVVIAQILGQEAGAFVEQKFGFITFAIAIAAVLLLESRLRARRPAEVLPLQPKPT